MSDLFLTSDYSLTHPSGGPTFGVHCQPSQTFSVGQTVSMTFMSPDNQKPFKIDGEIIHITNDGVGVKFKIESQVQTMVLKSYIDMIQG